MLSKIRKFADENKLLLRGDRIVAGISGGADSTALFYVLVMLREERGFSFSVLHVHHGIRGAEADRDEAFVLALARKYDVPARSVRINVPEEAAKMGLGLEEAGRILRRKALLDETDRLHANRIALAHHRDDLAETVLMNLARGTGLAGIAGIRPV
ncbi:MAG: tRNA lysidine(34) synthetase TilS, partial [Lachnospiraceae bacterium]|nr:tRNA lysidine(34) synthetase TilS [Lachnospiraceae bacterium]